MIISILLLMKTKITECSPHVRDYVKYFRHVSFNPKTINTRLPLQKHAMKNPRRQRPAQGHIGTLFGRVEPNPKLVQL